MNAEDDGSLAFLGIAKDPDNVQFHCEAMASSKTELARVLDFLKAGLSELKLELKGNEQIFPIADNREDRHGRGVDFVGFVFYHSQTMMRKSIKQSFVRKCAWLNRTGAAGRNYRMGVSSWLGWAKYSNSHNLCDTISKNKLTWVR